MEDCEEVLETYKINNKEINENKEEKCQEGDHAEQNDLYMSDNLENLENKTNTSKQLKHNFNEEIK